MNATTTGDALVLLNGSATLASLMHGGALAPGAAIPGFTIRRNGHGFFATATRGEPCWIGYFASRPMLVAAVEAMAVVRELVDGAA